MTRVTVSQLGGKVDALVKAVNLDREHNAKEHKELGRDMRSISRTLRGFDSEVGLVAEVKSLKDDRTRRDKHILALWVGFIAMTFGTLAAYIRSRLGGL